MQNTFLIIDDDINIRKMLAHIIAKNDLGKVVAELDSGLDAEKEILFYNPDVVLIDLLLPVKDGIQIIENVKAEGYKGKFIMISQVEDDHMISKAYERGIVFFIGKPINLTEAVNVIKGVCRNIELERSFELIRNAVVGIGGNTAITTNKPSINDEISRIFTDIGIISESGVKDLISLIKKVIDYKKQYGNQQYQLQEFYRSIAEEDPEIKDSSAGAKAIEQRIRRTILKALENIATLGYDDFYSSKFVEYSTLLFDFKQVKQEMRYLENSKEERGKINIRKFIEGVINKLNI